MITHVDIDGFVLHDQAAPGPVWLEEPPYWFFGSPTPRVNRQSRPDMSGTLELTKYDQGRGGPLTGFVSSSSWGDVYFRVDQLKALLAPGTTRKMTVGLADGTQRWCWIVVDSELTPDLAGGIGASPTAAFTVNVYSEGPIVYGSVLRALTYTPVGAPTTGVSFPMSFPTDWGGVSGQLGVTNAGTVPSPPVIVFQGPWGNPPPYVQNTTTGAALYLKDITLAAGETVTVDCAAETITYQGAEHDELLDWSRSDWLLLAPGDNTLLAGGGYASGAQLTIQAYDAYR